MPHRQHILTLDILRGYFLLVIFVDHFYKFPSLFMFFTGGGQLWVSAAEGFFIISGLLVGHIYGSKILTDLRGVWLKLWRRALVLYLLSVGLTLLFTFWGHFLPLDKVKYGLMTNPNLFDLLSKTLTLKYVYGWADYLAYYTVFMFFAPLALYIAKKFHPLPVLAASFVLWFFFRQSNEFFAWQLLFMSGLLVGTNLSAIESKIKSLARPLLLTSVITLLISVNFIFISGQNRTMIWLFDKYSVGIGRYFLAWLWFASAYLFIRSHESAVDRFTAGVLKTFGQKSLFVYCAQAVFLFPINYLLQSQFWYVGNTLITILGIAFIYLVTVSRYQVFLFFKNLTQKFIRPQSRLSYAYQFTRVLLLALLQSRS